MATTVEPQTTTTTQVAGGPTKAKGWGTDAPDQPLRPMEFDRRPLRPDDVAIAITYAGICHSDLHTARNDWGGTRYPVIPGHARGDSPRNWPKARNARSIASCTASSLSTGSRIR